nr:AAA family ATPase [uncultured Ligilactobacillus sp.]
MKVWIIPSNIKVFNVIKAFQDSNEIDWIKSRNMKKMKVDDIVYIYVAHPIKKILYKTKVIDNNALSTDIINNNENYKVEETVRLKLIKEYPNDNTNPFRFNLLQEFGLKGSIQGPQTINEKLLEYIQNEGYKNISCENYVNSKNAFQPLNIANNIIYYGVPGTGKSYKVSKLIKENNISNKNVFRITLHPEYSYNDFIGQIMPDVDNNMKPTYRYEKGIFIQALERALIVDSEPVLLIMEELSRANISSVFGDIFQLLDRDVLGNSEYSINNDSIYYHLDEKAQKKCNNKNIILPKNLYIIGTANTSDQNVFPMDTAFKRRFEWEYVPILMPKKENNPKISLRYSQNYVNTTWSILMEKLNSFIVNEMFESEDKQIGPYFIKFSNDKEINKRIIKNKLLQYLWDNIENSNINYGNARKRLFKSNIHSFSTLYQYFDQDRQIFSDAFLNRLGEQDDKTTGAL